MDNFYFMDEKAFAANLCSFECQELLRIIAPVFISIYIVQNTCLDRYHVTGVQQCSPKSYLYYRV